MELNICGPRVVQHYPSLCAMDCFLTCFKDLIAELINSDWIGDFENSVAALKMRRIANNKQIYIYR